MDIKFQYNKTSLQGLEKQLKVRIRALPTIKNKESALRVEVLKAKDKTNALEVKIEKEILNYNNMMQLWNEFDASLVAIKNVDLSVKKIAGVKIPVLNKITFSYAEFNLFNNPSWFILGVEIVKKLAHIGIEYEVYKKQMELLDFARRKTTQKVNLYEKVQIPGYNEAIMKIKRYMEDEENLSKSAQKIVKNRKLEEVV